MNYITVVCLAMSIQLGISICILIVFDNGFMIGLVLLPMALFTGYNAAEWVLHDENIAAKEKAMKELKGL